MTETCDTGHEADGALYLHSKCHLKSPTWVTVQGDDLNIYCAQCGKFIAHFKIQR